MSMVRVFITMGKKCSVTNCRSGYLKSDNGKKNQFPFKDEELSKE